MFRHRLGSPFYKLSIVSILGLLSSSLANDALKTKSAPGEFPAISMLPPGTVVEGITLPRYEKARVSSLIKAKTLSVVSRQEVSIKGLIAEIYNKEGFTTAMSAEEGNYNFLTSLVQSTKDTIVTDPRFRAQGKQLSYSVEKQRGMLRGPVRTILSLSSVKEEKIATP